MKHLSFSDRPEIQLANALLTNYNNMGIYFDKYLIDKYINESEKYKSELEIEIYRLARGEFKINSTNEYANVLIRVFGVDERDLKRKGSISVNKDVIAEITPKYNLPIFDMVNKYKSISKRISSFTGKNGICSCMQPTDLVNDDGHELGVVVPRITVAETGRYTFKEPSVGNLARDVMQFITAPEGYSVVSMDTCQQEIGILLNGVLNVKYIKNLFKENPQDKYIVIAGFALAQEVILEKIYEFLSNTPTITPIDWVYPFLQKDIVTGQLITDKKKYVIDYNYLNMYAIQHVYKNIKVTPEQRNGYKLAFLSGGYGAYENTLKAKVGDKIGASFYRMLNTLPEMQDYRERAAQYINCGGKSVNTVFGTSLTINDYNSKKERRTFQEKLNCFVNYPTQGTAADLLKFAIVDFYKWTVRNRLTPNDVRILTTRHDETVFLIKDEFLDRLPEIKDILEVQIEDWEPIFVECKYGKYYTK